ncbi:hypothetical protein [Epibacterium ulvae]|uniref:NfeD-like C-terminal, partner-binding n=1 Tax=Epibacterium ulvae TaxID=1156985 RepID=A0A1G5QN88_9RHOB|nr:hypothetical protein [Epibacterium ulvae]SCZ63116.1 hypothetical protein SAMN04488118_10525 [Epibacterium ulvae]
MDYIYLWWSWGAFALLLLIIEILAPGFVFLGFGISAAVISLGFLIAPGFAPSISLLLLGFSLLALITWLILRRVFALPSGQVKTFDHDIND